MKRLPTSATQRVDTSQVLSFSWQGQPMQGLVGDSVASALFANGVRIISRSLKYHRPRGLYSLDGESANCLVNVDGECNVRAETSLLKQGARVTAQNYAGSVDNDRYAFMGRFDRFMPAGFYYRRFHRPAFMWPMVSKFMRKMAGTGVLDRSVEWDSNRYAECYPNTDVAVIGGGPAGMSAALAAAEQGLRVIIFEARPWLGGCYDWRVKERNGDPLHRIGLELAGQVAACDHIRVFSHTAVIDLSGGTQITAVRVGGPEYDFDQQYIRTRPRSIVVATGCLERPLIFEDNEKPGVMQIGCAWRLARTYALLPGKKAVFSIGDDLGLEAALDLSDMGLDVIAVADLRCDGQDAQLLAGLEMKGIPFFKGRGAVAATGRKWLQGVRLADLNGRNGHSFECDLLVASAGQSPVIGPLVSAGAKLIMDQHTGFFLPREMPPRIHAAGRLLGLADPVALEASGRLAGLKAAGDAGAPASLTSAESELAALPGPVKGSRVAYIPGDGRGRKSFICFDEDGTLIGARQSAEQGFDLPELAKRFGGFGLGPGQSGVPGHNLPLVMAKLRGDSTEELLPTTVRSPFTPVLMAAIGGSGRPLSKHTPMYDQQAALGAVFEKTGAWIRALRFSADAACSDEIEAVRTKAGMIDVSTLGKFRLYGPDAEKMLQRVYISNMRKTTHGRLKYSAMLNDHGMLLDDGVITRIAEDDFYITTSSARADVTEEWFRYHSRFEDWNYAMVNLTDHLAAINLAGPNSREILAKLTDADLSNQAFPYMGYREFSLKEDIPLKALRMGFLGELSYELHFPASYGPTVWNLLLDAGAAHGLVPVGLEAQNVCRFEKGHVIIGIETEQRVNLLDLGLGFLWDRSDTMSRKVGAPALKFTETQTGRMKLAGIRIDDDQGCPGDGAIIIQKDSILGHVCTARKSTVLGKSIAMVLVHDSLAAAGNRIQIYQNEGHGERRFMATVVELPFYDPAGQRLRS